MSGNTVLLVPMFSCCALSMTLNLKFVSITSLLLVIIEVHFPSEKIILTILSFQCRHGHTWYDRCSTANVCYCVYVVEEIIKFFGSIQYKLRTEPKNFMKNFFPKSTLNDVKLLSHRQPMQQFCCTAIFCIPL